MVFIVFMYPFLKVSETKTVNYRVSLYFICIGPLVAKSTNVVEKLYILRIIRYIDAFVPLFSYLYLVSTNNLLIKTTVGSLKQQKMLIPKPKTHNKQALWGGHHLFLFTLMTSFLISVCLRQHLFCFRTFRANRELYQIMTHR